MEQRGWEVIYLGQSVASDGLALFLERLAPGLLCLSISLVEHLAGLMEICRLAEPLRAQGLVVGYAGHSFDEYPELAQRIPAVFLGNDLIEAVNQAEALDELLAREHAVNDMIGGYRPHKMIQMAVGS
jgi:MerR family transcriptional regulator, light-induced transcriptional regulator